MKLLLLVYCTAFWNRFAGKSFEKGKSKNLQPHRLHSLLRYADCVGFTARFRISPVLPGKEESCLVILHAAHSVPSYLPPK